MSEWWEDHMLFPPTLLLSSENHPLPPYLTILPPTLSVSPLPAKLLSHLVGDLDDSGQGLEGEGMQVSLERRIWAEPPLFFPSLLPSAGEG